MSCINKSIPITNVNSSHSLILEINIIIAFQSGSIKYLNCIILWTCKEFIFVDLKQSGNRRLMSLIIFLQLLIFSFIIVYSTSLDNSFLIAHVTYLLKRVLSYSSYCCIVSFQKMWYAFVILLVNEWQKKLTKKWSLDNSVFIIALLYWVTNYILRDLFLSF